jgi:HSP20 family protein
MSVKWDPFRDLTTIQEHMNRLFDVSVSEHRHQDGMAGWHPPSDICEAKTGFHLYVEIAGVDPDTIDLKVEGKKLFLKGERKRPLSPDQTYHQTEILVGPFHRTFSLPADIDPDRIDAKYNKGILEITIPKSDAPDAKEVPIKIK